MKCSCIHGRVWMFSLITHFNFIVFFFQGGGSEGVESIIRVVAYKIVKGILYFKIVWVNPINMHTVPDLTQELC